MTEQNESGSTGSTGSTETGNGAGNQPAATQGAPGGGTAGDFDAAVAASAAKSTARAESMSPAELHAQAEKIMADKDSQFYKGGPDSDYEVALVYRHHELNAKAAEGPVEEMSTVTRLANRAISLGDLPIPEVNRQALSDPRALERDEDFVSLVRYADEQNISTPVLRQMLTSWANTLASTGGVLTEPAIAALKQEFAGTLHPQQAALLERFLREEVAPKLARMRRGR